MEDQSAGIRFRLVFGVAMLLGFGLYAANVIRTAWLSYDAFVGLRTVEHLLQGEGLRFNVAERVQTFTSPLWMLLLGGVQLLSGNWYYATLGVSVVLSLAAVSVMAIKVSPSRVGGFALLIVLASSRAFVDYSTSGLELPLTHLLLAVTLAVYVERETWGPTDVLRFALLVAFGAINRLDTLLLTGPLLVTAWLQAGPVRAFPWLCLGLVPWLGWELCSLVYYGFPLPLAAYAQRAVSLTLAERLDGGLTTLLDTIAYDPIAVVVVGCGVLAPLLGRAGELTPLSIGIVLQLGYVVFVSGDEAAGRPMTAPMLVALAALVRAFPAERPGWLVIVAAAVAGSLSLGQRSPLLADSGYGVSLARADVYDARALAYEWTGLLRDSAPLRVPDKSPCSAGDEPVRVIDTEVGLCGFGAPSGQRIVDNQGIVDPLIARLRPQQRVRTLPDGYLALLRGEREHLDDPGLDLYVKRLRLVTEGQLLDPERWAAIWELNSGALDGLLTPPATAPRATPD
jgi:arabinofuranosyltransferase